MQTQLATIKAPHIEPPLKKFQAIVEDVNGDQETVHPFAVTAVGASQIVQFFMPDRMLVQLTRMKTSQDNRLSVNEQSFSDPYTLKGDCHDPHGGAMLKLIYVTGKLIDD